MAKIKLLRNTKTYENTKKLTFVFLPALPQAGIKFVFRIHMDIYVNWH